VTARVLKSISLIVKIIFVKKIFRRKLISFPNKIYTEEKNGIKLK
jgi:hypothetical protein